MAILGHSPSCVATHHATGRRVRDLPITPAKLLRPE
jgi:CO/xanthine dehydrogenase Mo-binding subunit